MDSMDNVHGLFPWTLSMDNFHGHCPLSPWKKTHGFHGKIHGHTGKNPWTFSMESLEIVHCFHSNTPAGLCPWILSMDSMDFVHCFHGLSTDGYLFMTNLGKMNNCPIFLVRNCCKEVDFQFLYKCPEMLQFISEGP